MLSCHWRQNLGAKWTPVTRSLFSSTNHRASKDNHILPGNSSGLQQNTTHSCTKALTFALLCTCLHQLSNTDMSPPLPHSRHTAWAYAHTLLHKAGRSFRYNTPINTTFHSQHLRWRAAAPEWRIPADSGCTPPWLIHCEPETGGEKTVYTETSI